MRFLNKLERKYGRYGIPNLMIYVVATMFAAFILDALLNVNAFYYLEFNRALILKGQIWRLVTFLFIPPSRSPIMLLIGLYFYYFIGSSLENVWGSFRFTVYYLFGAVGAIIAGFIAGGSTNTFLNMSLFFAFAQLFPDHQVLLFFIIPIKVKWLALLNWVLFLISFIQGTFVDKICILFSLVNFFIFFGPDIYHTVKNKIRYSKNRKKFRKQMNDHNDIWR